ncbi:nuclear transport factor 2 family protein [Anaerolinea thermophila]|uniref:SnoaL-like domain-containing protein n=1 Tax=Anaerolinea thermophila (strain DSM 14523 / JCM 11388 / NBRC 100420 / UNI-1) TaxID=926569 RepID=E8N2M6_ANATU|nr:nuclear transport factor 2 family protein [Anaerolinea thermophila]BAJ62832.1 hypothetical protein ANT_07980 [Anaerolinea thermophila UNI-1]
MNLTGKENTTIEIILCFNEALNQGNVDGMMNLMSEDCIFENTSPAPDGSRYQGKTSVRLFWEQFFKASQNPKIEMEEIFACGDHAVMRWVYTWQDGTGTAFHIRGVDVYLIRDGRIAQKLSYVKG